MNKLRRLSLMLALGALLVLPATALAIPVFVGGQSGRLTSIDSVTGAVTLIGDTGVTMHDIAQDAAGNLFGIDDTDTLYSIDTTNAGLTSIGNVGAFITGMTFDSAGTLYASGNDTLFTVDTASAARSLVGNTGFNSSGDIAFDSNGNLFMSADAPGAGIGGLDQLVSLDVTTGAGTAIGTDMGLVGVLGLFFDGNTLVGSTLAGGFHAIDISTGLAGPLLVSHGESTFGTSVAPVPAPAQVPAPVPEPATMILFGTGLFGIAAWRRFKRGQGSDLSACCGKADFGPFSRLDNDSSSIISIHKPLVI